MISAENILKNRFFRTALITSVLLLMPLVAMQFTNEVNWDIMDFLLGGFLLFCLGISLDTIIRKFPEPTYQIGLSIILLILFLLVWAELAVGIFGTRFSGS